MSFQDCRVAVRRRCQKLVAERLKATYLRIDTIEQAILSSSLNLKNVEESGYLSAYRIAQDNLRLGNIVVTDSVNPNEISRQEWFKIADEEKTKIHVIEVICSDKNKHQKRTESRLADIVNHLLPTWADVLSREYAPWTTERFVVDTADKNIGTCVEEIIFTIKP